MKDILLQRKRELLTELEEIEYELAHLKDEKFTPLMTSLREEFLFLNEDENEEDDMPF